MLPADSKLVVCLALDGRNQPKPNRRGDLHGGHGVMRFTASVTAGLSSDD